MSSVNKLIKNTAIFGVSNFASKLLVFLMLPFYTRVLSTSDFGNADLVVSIVSLLLPIVTLCVSEGALRFAMSKSTDNKLVFSYGLRVILIGFLVLVLFFPIVQKIPLIRDYSVYFYGLILFSGLNNYFNNFNRGINNIRLIGVVGVIATIVLVISNILFLVTFDMRVDGYLLAQLLMHLISTLILFFVGRLYNYITFERIPKNTSKEINEFNIPLIPNRISWILIQTFNKYSISYFIGASAVGIFSAANRIPSIITAIYGIIQQALLLVVIEEYEDGENSSLFKNSYYFLQNVLIVLVLLINILLKPFAELIFSDSYYEAYKYAQLMVISTYFGCLHGNLTTIFTATKETKLLFQNSLIGLIMTMILNISIVPVLGIYGASVSSVIVYFIMWFRLFSITSSKVGLRKDYVVNFSTFGLVIFQSILYHFQSNFVYYLLSSIVLCVVIYLKRKDIKIIIDAFYKLISKKLNSEY